MYRNKYQRGLLTIFYSCGSKPLNLWDSYIKDGYISKFLDQDIKSTVLEIGGSNVSTTYIICPKGNLILGIHMPFLVMVVKNLKKYFSFEVTVLDETGTRRRFRVSNFQSTTQILPLCTVMPIGLADGWNQIQFNMAEFMRRAYQKQFVEVQKLKINANIRLRRVYFSDRLIAEDELPPEYKLYFPIANKSGKNRNYVKDKKSSEELTTSPVVAQVTTPIAVEENKNTITEAAKPVEVKGSKTIIAEGTTLIGEENNVKIKTYSKESVSRSKSAQVIHEPLTDELADIKDNVVEKEAPMRAASLKAVPEEVENEENPVATQSVEGPIATRSVKGSVTAASVDILALAETSDAGANKTDEAELAQDEPSENRNPPSEANPDETLPANETT